MTRKLIKYYGPTTCYDGGREFVRYIDEKSSEERHYPDEYLIARILRKYLKQRMPEGDTRIIVLTEPWKGEYERKGDKNTDKMNKSILRFIQHSSGTELLLVPFLYGYHHPGIAIDLKNKVAIYVDPFGDSITKYPETTALKPLLEEKGFRVECVTTAQQPRGVDGTSCGPILTFSMMKFIEEFLSSGNVTTQGFQAPKSNLATNRLFQIYINNNVELEGHSDSELMLATQELWRHFLSEQKMENVMGKLSEIFLVQEKYIKALKKDWHKDPNIAKRVKFICDFQSLVFKQIFFDKNLNIEETLLIAAKNIAATPMDDIMINIDLSNQMALALKRLMEIVVSPPRKNEVPIATNPYLFFMSAATIGAVASGSAAYFGYDLTGSTLLAACCAGAVGVLLIALLMRNCVSCEMQRAPALSH